MKAILASAALNLESQEILNPKLSEPGVSSTSIVSAGSQVVGGDRVGGGSGAAGSSASLVVVLCGGVSTVSIPRVLLRSGATTHRVSSVLPLSASNAPSGGDLWTCQPGDIYLRESRRCSREGSHAPRVPVALRAGPRATATRAPEKQRAGKQRRDSKWGIRVRIRVQHQIQF